MGERRERGVIAVWGEGLGGVMEATAYTRAEVEAETGDG
jgi:hypothetical protein